MATVLSEMSESVRLMFWARVKKTARCWEWTGATANGYGQFMHEGRRYRAHRLVYESRVGTIPPRFVIHHRCENKVCVRPEHLELRSASSHGAAHGRGAITDRSPIVTIVEREPFDVYKAITGAGH